VVLSLLSFRGSSHGGQSDWLAPQMGFLGAVRFACARFPVFNGELEHDEAGKGRDEGLWEMARRQHAANHSCARARACRGESGHEGHLTAIERDRICAGAGGLL
jgi:hypothetical protein